MLTILMEMRLILSENDIEIVCSTGSDTSITVSPLKKRLCDQFLVEIEGS